jgi:hypothetical protein
MGVRLNRLAQRFSLFLAGEHTDNDQEQPQRHKHRCIACQSSDRGSRVGNPAGSVRHHKAAVAVMRSLIITPAIPMRVRSSHAVSAVLEIMVLLEIGEHMPLERKSALAHSQHTFPLVFLRLCSRRQRECKRGNDAALPADISGRKE